MITSSITTAGNPAFPDSAQSGASITLDASSLQKIIQVTTGASDSAVTLPTSGSSNGSIIYVRKADSGAGKVVINTSIAYLMTQGDIICLVYTGAAWQALEWFIAPVIDIFISSGTWTKRPLLHVASVFGLGAGGGGGSGRKGAVSTVRCGGGGGQSGAYVEREIMASILGSTETVTIATGGTGGTSQTTNSTNGNNGNTGGSSTFGSWITLNGGSGGLGGATTTGSGGSTNAYGFINGINGGTTTTTTSATGGVGIVSASGGGSGGVATAGDVAGGGAQALGGGDGVNVVSGGTAGSAGAGGGNGTSQSTTFPNGFCGGGGGGGGSASITTNAGAGGNAGFPGGGGGGGGGSLDSVGNSGAGGNGADGCFYIINYFN